MRIGMVNNIGFQGNYYLNFKKPEEARAFKNALNSTTAKVSAIRTEDYGKYKASEDIQALAGVVVRTTNPQFSLNDEIILNYGLSKLNNEGAIERARVSDIFDKNAPIIDYCV